MCIAEKVGVGVVAIQSSSVLSSNDKRVYERCNEKGDL